MESTPSLPLLDNDLHEPGVFDATTLHGPQDIARVGVICFFNELLERLVAQGDLRVVYTLRSEIGVNFVYELRVGDQCVTVAHPGVGAPLAAGYMEELVALGVRTFVACGGAGALVEGLALGHVMVVDSALRDEGTSFHYAPPGRIIEADADSVEVLHQHLLREGIDHFVGRTWTTDAIFRETKSRIRRRIDEGCSMVDMESSALIAIARYRQLQFAQILYAGDSLAGETWDERSWQNAGEIREKLFYVAARAALALAASSA